MMEKVIPIEEEQEFQPKQTKFSKIIIAGIIILNIIFTSIILLIVASGIPEPTTLIISWFAFTTVEVAVLAGIRKAEINMNPFNPYSPQNPHIYYGDKEPK